MATEPMTEQHAFMIVAATIAASVKYGRPRDEIYNEYVALLPLIQRQGVNPSRIARNEPL
jgi:hypothetical protein